MRALLADRATEFRPPARACVPRGAAAARAARRGRAAPLQVTWQAIQWLPDAATVDSAQFTQLARSADTDDLARAAAKIPGQVTKERPVVELIYELYSVNRLTVRGHVRLKPYTHIINREPDRLLHFCAS